MSTPDFPTDSADSIDPIPDEALEEVAGGGFWEDLKDWLGYPDPDNPSGDDN